MLATFLTHASEECTKKLYIIYIYIIVSLVMYGYKIIGSETSL